MQRAVHGPGRRVGRVVAVHHVLVVRIEEQQVAGLDGREVLPTRVEQELAAVAGDDRAEVVADALAPAELVADAEGGREILPQGGKIGGRQLRRRGAVVVHALKRPSVTSAR